MQRKQFEGDSRRNTRCMTNRLFPSSNTIAEMLCCCCPRCSCCNCRSVNQTELCRNYDKGQCTYGGECFSFFHTQDYVYFFAKRKKRPVLCHASLQNAGISAMQDGPTCVLIRGSICCSAPAGVWRRPTSARRGHHFSRPRGETRAEEFSDVDSTAGFTHAQTQKFCRSAAPLPLTPDSFFLSLLLLVSPTAANRSNHTHSCYGRLS